MTLSLLLIFLIATVGMTYIMVEGNFPLVKWMREKVEISGIEWLQDLWSCHMCMGWWCGLFMGLLLYPPGWFTFPLACAGSAASYGWSKLIELLAFSSSLQMVKYQISNIDLTNLVSQPAEEEVDG